MWVVLCLTMWYAVLVLQVAAEKVEELKSRETKSNEQISQLHRQHADEQERLGREHAADLQKLMDELSRLKESTEANSLEHAKDSELIYYQCHLEAMEQINELRDLVAERQTDIENLQENLRHRDTEIEQLKADISSHDGGLIAAIQLDLERVTAER